MAYTSALTNLIWQNAQALDGENPDLWRVDPCGAKIGKLHYELTGSQFGWKICRINQTTGDEPTKFIAINVRNDFDPLTGKLVCRFQLAGTENVPMSVGEIRPINQL